MPILRGSLVAVLLTAFTLAPARAQEVLLSRAGTSPAVAADGRGSFVITWTEGTDVVGALLPKGAGRPRAPFPVSFLSEDRVSLSPAGRAGRLHLSRCASLNPSRLGLTQAS